MIQNIFDYVDTIEYPSEDLLVDGIKDGNSFDYVSTTYLNGFINYVNLIDAYMIRRYKELTKNLLKANRSVDELTWEGSCELVDNELEDASHIHFKHTTSKYDDMLILAKQAGSYWVFWVDCDSSDCCLARMPESTFNSVDEAREALKIAALQFSEPGNTEEEKIKQIPTRFFNGWITF